MTVRNDARAGDAQAGDARAGDARAGDAQAVDAQARQQQAEQARATPGADPHSDSFIRLLIERGQRTLAVASGTARLAAAESRLAATSVGMIVALGLGLVALAVVSWLLLLMLIAVGLHALALGPAPILAILLLLHLLAAAGLWLMIRRLSRHLHFTHTRQAIALRQTLKQGDPLTRKSPV